MIKENTIDSESTIDSKTLMATTVKVSKPTKLGKILGGLIVVAVALLGLSATPALAESPWWQVTSGSAPTRLVPGSAVDEVQEINVAPETAFILEVGGVEVGAFESEPYPFEFLPYATAENVQTALESVYGAGNVVVTGGPGGSAPLKVTSINEDAGRHVEKIEMLAILGSGEASVTSEGRADGSIVLTATNLGDAAVNGSPGSPVTITDKLPAGLEAIAISGLAGVQGDRGPVACSLTPAASTSLSCTWTGPEPLAPYESIEVVVAVNLREHAESGESNEVTIAGGQTPRAVARRPVAIGSEATQFGVATYQLTPENEGGSLDTQAGSHPFQLTSTLALNQTAEPARPPALVKDLHFNLPPGLIGNPTPFPQCTGAEFLHLSNEDTNSCPADTAVGVSVTTLSNSGGELITKAVPLFNLTPSVGEPARFGFEILGVPVTLDTSVRTGGDYGVVVSVKSISQIFALASSRVTFWGIPGEASHNQSRGWRCIEAGADRSEGEAPCGSPEEASPPPLLTLPTSCTGSLQTSVEADSWAQPGNVLSFAPSEPEESLDSCNHLPFSPSIEVAPDGEAASTPTGLAVDVKVPQEISLNPEGLAESDVQDTTVALPAGVQLSPSGGNGLQACSSAQIGLEDAAKPSCPDASKVATVKIKSPLLPNPLEGAVYLAAPQNFAGGPLENPFRSLIAMYIVAEDPVSGVLVKLPGRVTPNPVTGQLVSTFENTPQLPFEELELHFFGTARAPLSTPATCGTYTTQASFTPWSGNPAVTPSSSFNITSGPNGAPCPDPQPFAPGFQAGSANLQAGAFTPFTTTMTRPDADQTLGRIEMRMPPGLSGTLSNVKLCDEPQASQGKCGPESLIGETVVSAGLGSDPYTVTGGKVYITTAYGGGQFGLSIVNPAAAGPFVLDEGRPIVVRAAIFVDPHTAALRVVSEPLPTILDGIPLQLQHVYVNINRPNFTFNPTNCEPMGITGTISSSERATAAVSTPFQVTNCATLAFKPKLAASTSSKTSKADGASLTVKLIYPNTPQGTEANIAKVKVDLPKQLPSRLTTLQKACLAAVFDANPANCPAASIIGHAKAVTPLIPVPLEGPAYFVSHGGEAFPSLIIVLQGYGVTLDLVGTTFISKAGITSSTFKTVPDAPVGSFELTLPEGKFSALGTNKNLCALNKTVIVKKNIHGHIKRVKKLVGESLVMPTEFVAQNGAKINESTKVAVTGCKKAHKASRHHKKKGKGKKKG